VRPLARWGGDAPGQVRFSPDGRFLAVASPVGIYLYDVQTPPQVRFIEKALTVKSVAQMRLIEAGDWVKSVAFSPDGATMALGANNGAVRLRRVADGALLRTLQGNAKAVTSLAFSPDGATMAAGSEDKTVRLWRVSDGAPLCWLEGHVAEVSSVAFSPDGAMLASASHENGVRLWRTSDGALLRMTEAPSSSVVSAAFSPDGTTVAGASSDKMVWLWRVNDGALVRKLVGHTDSVTSVAFSPDGKILASGSSDKTVRLWRVHDGSLLHTLEGHTDLVLGVAFSPNGKVLASGSRDKTIRLWRVSDGALLRTLEEHTALVEGLAFSPDGLLLASGSWDGTVRLWGDVTAGAGAAAPAATAPAPARATPAPFSRGPRFINHERPKLALDIKAFTDAGCMFDEHRALKCWDSGPLKDLGANWLLQVPDLLGGLRPAYPMAEWSFSGKQPSVYCHDFGCVGYIVYLQDHFVMVNTEEDLRAIFAPIESEDEALSYAIAATGLDAYYGLKPFERPAGCRYLVVSSIEYDADVVEDSHVDKVSDGYQVHLFDCEWGGHGDPPCRLTAVDLHITDRGYIVETGRKTMCRIYGGEIEK
jgi:WD40 repeat protein